MKHVKLTTFLQFLIILYTFGSCSTKEESIVHDDKAIADEEQISNWLAYGRTHNERRFSPSTAINTTNVSDLKVDWFIDLPNDVGLVSTPLVVDGILYFTGNMNIVKAVDAVTGTLIWEHDPKVAKAVEGKRKIGWKHNRGLSYYEGKIFTATWMVDCKLLMPKPAIKYGLYAPLIWIGPYILPVRPKPLKARY